MERIGERMKPIGTAIVLLGCLGWTAAAAEVRTDAGFPAK
jgi:hypothetical protein